MKLASGINKLYPGAILRGEATVQDDGHGPYIAHWKIESLGPMPSLAELDAAGQQAEQEVKAQRSDRATLRDQILAETPEQWAARAAAERWLIVLRILKHWARST